MKTLKEMDFKEKKVLIRVDYNVPLDDNGNITDDFRIKESLPTLNYIIKQCPKQLILMTHIGRPENKEPKLNTGKVAERVGKLLGKNVKKIDGWSSIGDAQIVMLENLRFNNAEQSKDIKEKDLFGRQLASLADVYVNEAFSNCHRDDASMVSVPKFIHGCIGFAVEKEIGMIKSAINNPERPFVAIIGGLKADKIPTIKNLVKKADKVLIGGALAFLILKIAGQNVGKSKIDIKGLNEADAEKDIKELLNNPKIELPVDCIVADRFDEDAEEKEVLVSEIPDEWMALDIGTATIKHYTAIIKEAKTVVWNGPIGVFEFKKFSKGTKEIAKAIVKSGAKSIVGGGDSAAAVEKLGYAKKMTHVSTGGGASLVLFEGKELAALKAL